MGKGAIRRIDVHLYGKLRRFAEDQDVRSASIVRISRKEGDTVATLIERLGIPQKELGSNLFVNGRYADLASPVPDGARLGLFPDDMQLLYKWYYEPTKASASANQGSVDGDLADASTSTNGDDHAG